ncbi:adenylyl cyclase CyaB, putative [Paenimyroides ummariense]|uniref:Adenylyl cyclase CyaB, putative n=1 Tax=Paenimyroides ummariense TaxID=913024 RepID=A0A1I5GQ03_9FLAO|nr:class IV adenylate cyclase [Paenimyroides ummariense]SFO38023.1 adenylyl cyclase CyaB, putative [Paenimyroides ummariense]
MKIKNFEFKAKVGDHEKYENLLLKLNPIDYGTDHQIDTYFNTPKGRLKLREIEGKESKLIDYNRENVQGSKKSDIFLYKHEKDEALKQILSNQMGIKVIVDKKRKIYGIDNVKFHFDTVENLGTFIEVEAIDETEAFTLEELKEQCDFYYDYFSIQKEQVEKLSYSDLLLQNLGVIKQ